MATFHPEVKIPQNAWVNLFTELSIPAGAAVKFQNTGGSDIRVVTSTSEPATISLGLVVAPGSRVYDAAPETGESFWAIGSGIAGTSGNSTVTVISGEVTVAESDAIYTQKNPMAVKETNLPLTAFGDLRVAELSPVFQTSFESTVTNTDIGTRVQMNGGTVTQASAMVVVSTGTTTAARAGWHTSQHAKYRAGLGGLVRCTVLASTGVAGTEQGIGLTDEAGSSASHKNGYVIGRSGSDFGFLRFANDELFFTPLNEWDDPLDGTGASGMTHDPTKLTVFFIDFRYLGAGAIDIWVENTLTGDIFRAHRELYSGLNTVPSVFNPNFKLSIYALNGGTTSNIVCKSGSMAYFVEGKTRYIETQQPHHTSERITKISVASEIALFTIRNKTSYAGKTNFIDLVLEDARASIEASSANNLGSIRMVRNATLGGTPSWDDINTTNSIVEIDTAGTTVADGKTLFDFEMAGKNDRVGDSLTDYELIIHPGETVTFAVESVNSATFKGSMLWKELF